MCDLGQLNMTTWPASTRSSKEHFPHQWRIFACSVLLLILCCFSTAASQMQYHFNGSPSKADRSCVTRTFQYPRDLIYEQKSINITLQVSNRPAHLIVTSILKILLQDVIGYRNVVLVRSNDTLNASAVMDAVSGMDQDRRGGNRILPSAMVNVEVWMPPGFNAEPWELSGGADHLGSLNSVGKFGWFVSDNGTDKTACNIRTNRPTPPGTKIDYEFWRAYHDISAVIKFDPRCVFRDQYAHTIKLFKAAIREECRYPGCRDGVFSPSICGAFYDDIEVAQYNPSRVRYIDHPCAVLLASTYNLQSESVLRQIDSLHLRVVVIFVGSRLEEIVNDRARAGLPILFFDYEPSVLTASSLYRRVAFEQCAPYETRDACDLPVNQLSTVAWSELTTLAPDVFNLTQRFRIPQLAYKNLIKNYADKSELERRSTAVYDIACEWVHDNQKEWSEWVREIRPKRLRLSGLFPLYDKNSADKCWGKSLELAANIAVKAINASREILPGYTLEIGSCNDGCDPAETLNCFMNDYRDRSVIGFVGPACSDATEPIVAFGKFAKTLVVSYGAEASGLTNRQYYPYFYRTIPDNSQLVPIYAHFMHDMGWTRLASISEDGQKYPAYLTKLQVDLGYQNISMLPLKFSRGASTVEEMMEVLNKIKAQRRRIIIGDFFEPQARAVMCAAYRLQMTASEGYVWFLPNWFSEGWFDPRKRRSSGDDNVAAAADALKMSADSTPDLTDEQQVPCNMLEMIHAINYHFTLEYRNYERVGDAETVGRYSIDWFKDELRTVVDTETYGKCTDKFDVTGGNKFEGYTYNKYSGYAHDAVWALALAYDKLLRDNYGTMPDLTNEHTIQMYADYIKQTDFNGVSGHVSFRGGNRIGDVFVRQRRFYSLNLTALAQDPDLMEMQVIYEFDMGNVTNATATRVIHDGAQLGAAALLGGGKIMWGTKDGKRPSDGTIIFTCAVEGLANWLGLTCTETVTLVVLGVVAIIVVIAGVSTGIVWLKYNRRLKKEKELRKHLQLRTGGDLLELTQWELVRGDVHLNRKIGRGNFGKVYGGEAMVKLNPDDPVAKSVNVAIKTLKDSAGLDEKLDFLAEAEIMRRLSHEHIVKLYGVTTGGKGPLQIVFEFALYSDVKTYLLSRREMAKQSSEDPATKMECGAELLTRFARDIACGLSYMHEMRLVHRDLAARNCLVSAERRVKIGDFGMCRPVINNGYYHFTRRGLMPVRWMAPESLADGIYTTASDIWSFGVVLYEIASLGGFPYPGKGNAEVMDMVKRGRRMKAPEGCVDELDMVFLQACHQFAADKRPTASKLFMDFKEYDRVVTPCTDEIDMFNNEVGMLTDAEDVDFQGHEVPANVAVDTVVVADGPAGTNVEPVRRIRRRGKHRSNNDTVDAADADVDEEASIQFSTGGRHEPLVRSLSASGRSGEQFRLQQPLLTGSNVPATSSASPRNMKQHYNARGSIETTASQQSINKLNNSQADLSGKAVTAATRAEDKAKRQELSKYLQRLQSSSSSHFAGLSSLASRAKRHASGTSSRHGDDEMEMTPTKSSSSAAKQRRWRLSSADQDQNPTSSNRGLLTTQQSRTRGGEGVHTPPNSNSAGAVVTLPAPPRRTTSAALMEVLTASDEDSQQQQQQQQQPNFLRGYNAATATATAASPHAGYPHSFIDRSHCVLPPINGSLATGFAKPPLPSSSSHASSIIQKVVAAVHSNHHSSKPLSRNAVDERPMLHEASVKFWHKRNSNVSSVPTDSRKSSSSASGRGGISTATGVVTAKPNTCQRNVPQQQHQQRASSTSHSNAQRAGAEIDADMRSRRSSASGISSLGISEGGDFSSFNDENNFAHNPTARFDVLGGGGGGGALYNTHSLFAGMPRGVDQHAETIGPQTTQYRPQQSSTHQATPSSSSNRQYSQPPPMPTLAAVAVAGFSSPANTTSSLRHRNHQQQPSSRSPQPSTAVVAPISAAHLRILEKMGGAAGGNGGGSGEPSTFVQPPPRFVLPRNNNRYSEEQYEEPLHVRMARKASYPTPIAVTGFYNSYPASGASRPDYAEFLPSTDAVNRLGGSTNSYIAMDGAGGGAPAFPGYSVPNVASAAAAGQASYAQEHPKFYYPSTNIDSNVSSNQNSNSSASSPPTPGAVSAVTVLSNQQAKGLQNQNSVYTEFGSANSYISNNSKKGTRTKAGSGSQSATGSGSRSEHSSGDKSLVEAAKQQQPPALIVAQQQQQQQQQPGTDFRAFGINAPVTFIPLSASNTAGAYNQQNSNLAHNIPSRDEQLRRLQQHQAQLNSSVATAASPELMAHGVDGYAGRTALPLDSFNDSSTPLPTVSEHPLLPNNTRATTEETQHSSSSTNLPSAKISPADSGRGGRFPRQSSGTSSSLASSVSPSTISSNGNNNNGGNGVRRHDRAHTERARGHFHQQRPSSFANAPNFGAQTNSNSSSLLRQHLLSASSDGVPPVAETGRFNSTGTSGVDTADDDENHRVSRMPRRVGVHADRGVVDAASFLLDSNKSMPNDIETSSNSTAEQINHVGYDRDSDDLPSVTTTK